MKTETEHRRYSFPLYLRHPGSVFPEERAKKAKYAK
jgi:hypothetical protein